MINNFDDTDIQELKNIIRVGIVSSVNTSKMTARVKIQEQDIVSGDLKILQNQPSIKIELKSGDCNSTYEAVVSPWKPKVGQYVACIFVPGGDGDGFILGGI